MAGNQGSDSGFGDAAKPRTGLTPTEIQQKEFAVARLGGYKMRDVDEYLDEITATVGDLLAENERLRRQAGAAPVLGSPDLDDVSRQADEIIQRSRDEAAKIVAGAKEQAAATGGTGTLGVAGAGDLAAVNAFLTQEREFLQSLAGLVQGHAESVKGMAKEARRPTKVAAPPPEPAPVAAGATTLEATPEEPIRVEEPEPAAAKPAASGKPSDAEGEGDSGLRELFWGDET